jgi:ferredoxin--NADP+ reductase
VVLEETILDVKHFTEDLFWFETTWTKDSWKNPEWLPGQFVMISLGEGTPFRAYSIASSPKQDTLEFLSIKVPDGPLTSKLQHVKVGDKLTVNTKVVGTLILPNLDIIMPEDLENTNKKSRLWCISTGTGLAPFLSIARDQEAYEYFDEVIVTHTCRTNDELVFRDSIESYGARVYQSVTREDPRDGVFRGRITDSIRDGSLFSSLEIDQTEFDPECDRIMICGGPSFNIEIMEMLEEAGWVHGTMSSPGNFVVERAFVETL